MARTYDRALLPPVLDDLRALDSFDEALIDIALQSIADLAEHRKIGKLLGVRHVSVISRGTGAFDLTFPMTREGWWASRSSRPGSDGAPLT